MANRTVFTELDECKKKLEDHEKRIKKLEKTARSLKGEKTGEFTKNYSRTI